MRQDHIGLTGMMASGKGEVVRILERRGYRYISLSDMVREEAARSGRAVSRGEMQDIGNRLRREGGPGILGKRVREKIEGLPPGKWIIDGIRNPHEVAELKQLEPFLLVAVISRRPLLLERLRKRMRDTDIAGEKQLELRLDREWGIGEPEGGQQVGRCVEMADRRIENNGSLEDLGAEVTRVLGAWEEQDE